MSLSVPTTTVLDQDLGELDPEVAFKIAAGSEFRERQQRALDGASILAERLTRPDCAEAGVHRVGIAVNHNAVPFDPRPPMITSGLAAKHPLYPHL